MHRNILCMVLLVVSLTALSCTGSYRLNRESLARPSIWPNTRGDLTATGAIAGSNYAGGLELIWKEKIGDRPLGSLIISHSQLVVPGSRKRLWFLDTRNGSQLGKLKVGGIPQGGIAVQDSLAYIPLAPPRDKLICYDLIHRQTRWQMRIKDAAFGPIIVGNRLITSSSDGVLSALDPKTGTLIWKLTTESRLLGLVSSSNGHLFVGSGDGTLFAVSLSDGKELYRVNLKGPIVSAVAIAEYLYVANAEGQLFALHPADGAVAWKITLPSSTWTAPTVSDSRVIVACRNGDIVACDAATGNELWKHAAVDVVKASPIVVGKFVVVGTMTGRLLTLDAESGAQVNETTLEGAIAFSSVSDGSHIYVATQTGRVYCFGDPHEQRIKADH